MDIKKVDRIVLKRYFVKNAVPTAGNFADLIDGVINQKEDGIAKLAGEPLSVQADGDDASQKKAINFYKDFSDPKPAWTLSLNPRSDPAKPETARPGFSVSDAAGNSRLFIDQTTGHIGIGTAKPEAKLHVADGGLRLDSEKEIYFADNGQIRSLDNNHRILFRRTENIMELREYGDIVFSPGAKSGTSTATVTFKNNGNVEAKGAVYCGGSDLYFTQTDHTHTGIGNKAGHAAIENAKNYDALMILGRAQTNKGRKVRLWDYLEVNGQLDVTRNLVVKGVIVQQGWQPVAFQNGWKNYSGSYNVAGYFKDSMGIVHLRGLVKGGGHNAIFVLPSGYRPIRRHLFVVCTHSNASGRLDVLTDGRVHVVAGSGTWLSLDGLTFRAER